MSEYSIYNKKIYPLLKCKNCGLIRPNPLPYNNSTKIKVYNKADNIHFYNSKLKVIETENEDYKRYFKYFIPYQDLIKKYNIKGKALDIGCGAGHLLEVFKKNNLISEGTEINPLLVNALKPKFKVYFGEVENSKIKKDSYDLITFNQVLEHIEKPEEFIKKVNELLKQNGKIILAVPYLYGLVPTIIRKYWYGISKGQHLNFFSKKGLKILLERNGFEILEFKKLCVDYTHPKFPRFLNFINQKITNFIVFIGGGDNLFVVARKIS